MTRRAASWPAVALFMGHWHRLCPERLAIQTEIGYNNSMAVLQLIVVATLVSVLYVYLRQSNQD